MKTKYYAFWSYDLYPYLLSGEVSKFHDDGRVSVDGYGTSKFAPDTIMWGSKGLETHTQLKQLTKDHEIALKQFENEWLNKVKKLMKVKF